MADNEGDALVKFLLVGTLCTGIFLLGRGSVSTEPATPEPTPTWSDPQVTTEVVTETVIEPLPESCREAVETLNLVNDSMATISTQVGELNRLIEVFQVQVWTYDHSGAATTQEEIDVLVNQFGQQGVAVDKAQTQMDNIVKECNADLE